MYTLRKRLYVVNFLMCFILKSDSGNCRSRQPVIRVCTKDSLLNKPSVNIDTASVPRFQVNTCKCTISSSPSTMEFMFTYLYETYVGHTQFKINQTDVSVNLTTRIYDKTDLWFFYTNNTLNPTGCLIMSATVDGAKFNITCLANTTQSTTNTAKPYTYDSTSIVTLVTKRQMNHENTKGSDLDVIIPVVTATAGVVCLSCVVVVNVVCRRRLKKNKQASDTTASVTVAGKETEDHYYMTENPMYNLTETQPNIQSSESEYHYIEPGHEDDRMSSSQYESLPDSPVSKQFQNKQSNHDLHYDYTTCLSASDKNGTVVNNKISKNDGEDKEGGRSVGVNQPIAGEIMYDHTDTAMPKHFLSVNEYHHISPACSRKQVAIDTYNTIGNAKNNHIDNQENGEDSDYHVTNFR